MEHSLVTFLVVTIALVGGIAGSVLHESEVPIQQLLPYEVTYSHAASPVLLSQPLGLTVDALLAAAGYAPAPVPVAEVSVEDISSNQSVGENESGVISNDQATPGAAIAIGQAVPESPLQAPESPVPGPSSEVAQQIALGEQASPSTAPVASPLPASIAVSESAPGPVPPALSAESPAVAAESPVSPLPAAIDASALTPPTDVKLLDSITRGTFYIDANGKLQMQASYTSNGEGIEITATDLSQPAVVADATAAAVPVVVPELPVVAVAKPSKSRGASNVNVNVNVNVNGDGTGSSFNATSVSKIKAPIETSHKCH